MLHFQIWSGFMSVVFFKLLQCYNFIETKTGLMLFLSYLLGIIDNDVDLIAVFIPSRASSPFMMADFIPS